LAFELNPKKWTIFITNPYHEPKPVESGAASFDVILVYDVSRWGRFQDADESAYYEYLCKRRVRWFYERLYENLQVAHVRVDGPFFAPRGIADWCKLERVAAEGAEFQRDSGLPPIPALFRQQGLRTGIGGLPAAAQALY
jgi:hypothetical protein